DVDLVRGQERAREVVLEDARARGVRARLEDGDEPPAPAEPAQRFERGAHRGGMVREVVVDRDAPRLPATLETPLDAPEGGKRLAQRPGRRSSLGRDGERGERVAHVV